jgi:hypothetical protein
VDKATTVASAFSGRKRSTAATFDLHAEGAQVITHFIPRIIVIVEWRE